MNARLKIAFAGFIAAGMTGIGTAATISSIYGDWTSHTGGVGVVEIDDVPIGYGNTDEDQIRWGTGSSGQSGLGFTGNGTPMTFAIGDVFEIGQLRHFNRAINAGSAASAASLDIYLEFSDPSGLTTQLPFSFGINETPNAPGPPASDDIITFSSPYSTTYFGIGGVDYTLELLGFGPDALNLTSGFRSAEGTDNSALLFGKLTARSDIPGPSVPDTGSTLVFLGFGCLGLRFVKKLACK